MHFDTSPRVLHALNRRLRQDPRVIRWTMTKLGEKVEGIADLKEKTITRLSSTEESPRTVLVDQKLQSNT